MLRMHLYRKWHRSVVRHFLDTGKLNHAFQRLPISQQPRRELFYLRPQGSPQLPLSIKVFSQIPTLQSKEGSCARCETNEYVNPFIVWQIHLEGRNTKL